MIRSAARRCSIPILLVALAALLAGSAAGAVRHESVARAGIASSRYVGAGDGKRLAAVGATRSYDWSATTPTGSGGPPWVPMVWGSGSVTPAVIASLRADHRDGRAQDLLGFNEPDSGSEANMTPAQAAALWPSLERTGLALGSPAPAVPTDGWLAQFMKLVRQRHLRVDFIALHFYQDFTDPRAVSELRSQLIAVHHDYHRPIWITEIGAIDIRAWGEHMDLTPTPARARTYMRQLFTMLDGLGFVQRYAWFTDDCWDDASCHPSSLWNGTGQLTGLGRTFRNLTAVGA